MDTNTPRIHAALLPSFSGKTVRLVGAPLGYPSGNEVTLRSSDGQNVKVSLQQCDASAFPAKCVEILGRVNDDLSMTAFKATSFGDSFDLKLHDELITLENGVLQDLLFA